MRDIRKTRSRALIGACLLCISCSVEGAYLRRNEELLKKKEYGGERPVPEGGIQDLWGDVAPGIDDLDVASIWKEMERDPSSIPLPEEMVNNAYNVTKQGGGGTTRVVGGGDSKHGRNLFFSLIMRYNKYDRKFYDGSCGASLVSNCYILTAAHCVSDTRMSLNDAGFVGALRPFHGNENQPYHFSPFVLGNDPFSYVPDYSKALKRHPNWKPNINKFDLALLKLDKCLDRNSPIQPITLAKPSYHVPEGRKMDIMGFGKYTSDPTDREEDVVRLRSTQVPFIPNAKCKQIYSGRAWVAPDAVCAGYPGGGHDTCQGDSGGPMVDFSSGKPVQVGITSWGQGCALPNSPGVYTDVRDYYQWIQQTVCADPDTDQSIELCSGGLNNFNEGPKCDGSTDNKTFNYISLTGSISLKCTWLSNPWFHRYCDQYESARTTCYDACQCPN